MKRVLAACIEQVLMFDSKEEANDFIKELERKEQQYSIFKKVLLPNGKVQVRLKRQYNNNKLLGYE